MDEGLLSAYRPALSPPTHLVECMDCGFLVEVPNTQRFGVECLECRLRRQKLDLELEDNTYPQESEPA